METVRFSKWLKNKDYFGLWDLICVSSFDIRFVQVKTNAKPTRAWIEEATNWPCPPSAIKEWVSYNDYSRGCEPSRRERLGNKVILLVK